MLGFTGLTKLKISRKSPSRSIANLSLYDLNFMNDTYKGGTITFTGSGLSTDIFKYGGLFYSGGHTEQADGSVVLKTGNNSRRTDLGLWVEQSRTNSVLYSRDLTNAAWIKTNMTALKTTTGLDNIANSASSITATSPDATILQPITLASSQRFQSAYVKRLTGTGAISMTVDGGTSWTDITAQVTTGWTRISLLSATLANPHVGFKVAVSGDSFAIDFVQNENGNTISSPRQTAGTAVNSFGDRSTADDTSYASPLPPLLRGYHGWYMELSAARLEEFGPLVSSAGTQSRVLANGSFTYGAGNAKTAATPAGQFIRGKNAVNKIAAYLKSDGTLSVCCNGNPVVQVTGATPVPALTHMDLGTNGSLGMSIHGTVKRVAFFNPDVLTDADLVNFTTL